MTAGSHDCPELCVDLDPSISARFVGSTGTAKSAASLSARPGVREPPPVRMIRAGGWARLPCQRRDSWVFLRSLQKVADRRTAAAPGVRRSLHLRLGGSLQAALSPGRRLPAEGKTADVEDPPACRRRPPSYPGRRRRGEGRFPESPASRMRRRARGTASISITAVSRTYRPGAPSVHRRARGGRGRRRSPTLPSGRSACNR